MPPEPRRHAHIPKQTSSSGVISFGASAVVLSDIDSLMWIVCVILEESLGGNATVHQYDPRNVRSYQSNRFPGNSIKEFGFFYNPGGHFTRQRHSYTHMHAETQTWTAHSDVHTAFLSFMLISFRLTALHCPFLTTVTCFILCFFLDDFMLNHTKSPILRPIFQLKKISKKKTFKNKRENPQEEQQKRDTERGKKIN